MTNCNSCRYYCPIGEWSYPACEIADIKNDKTLLILGNKGLCPYHEYKEYYGMK